MLATVAVAAVLGMVITTMRTLAAEIFLQQANASSCHNILGTSNCSVENSFGSKAFNYLWMTEPWSAFSIQRAPITLLYFYSIARIMCQDNVDDNINMLNEINCSLSIG